MRILLVLILAFTSQLGADVTLPALISDNMVLQREMPVRVWGKAAAGEEVTVSMAGQSAKDHTEGDGSWEVFLPPMSAGGPYEITISASNSTTIRNVMVGDVWVASGQSNMAWTLRNSKNSDQEIAAANYPQIRFFQVRTTTAERPADDVKDATWKVINPDTAGPVSGVAYFFAREIHQTRGVAVGVLQSAVGGTPAQAWTSHETLHDDLNLHWYFDQWEKHAQAYPEAKAKYEAALALAQARAEGKPGPRPPQPLGAPGHTHTPSALYNGMIAPLTRYGIRGAIWYQGEANAGPTDNELYSRLFKEMILDWRRAWGQGQFPFLWVQLASYGRPAEGTWPLLRDSQTQALELTKTGQALAIDVGESDDIHPKDKLTVGHRLALAARAISYGESVVYSGPMLRGATASEGALRLWFQHTGSGLSTRNGEALTGFRVAGSDGRYFKAEARIEGNTVVVSSALVKDPVAVRYGWENDPVANLINKEGLPAVPARTDRWK